MSRRRRPPAVEPLRVRPPMPAELVVFDPAVWGAQLVMPEQGAPSAAWAAWADETHAAAGRQAAARQAWVAEHKHLPVPADVAVADEVWCGEFEEHDCGGADCPRRLGSH